MNEPFKYKYWGIGTLVLGLAAGIALVAKSNATAQEVPQVRVRQIDYVEMPDAARVVMELSGAAQPRVVSMSDALALLEFSDVELPADLERYLDVSDFAGPVRGVASFREPQAKNKVRVAVELTQGIKPTLQQIGHTWYWDFPRVAPQKLLPSSATASRQTPTEAPSPLSTPPMSAMPLEPPANLLPLQTQSEPRRRVYRGKRIDLDFKDVDIHNLMRLFADVGAVNIVVPDDVKATVTVRLRSVPWDQALEVILASKGLWYRRESNLIRVANRKDLDAEEQAEFERMRARVQQEAPEPEIFTLNYAEASDLATQVKPLLSPKGKIEVDKRTNSLIINDIAAHRDRIIELLMALDTQTPQIQIEARIVEARSTFARELGIQWGLGALASANSGNPTGLTFPSTVGAFGGATDKDTPKTGIIATNPDFAVNLPATVGTGAGGALGFTFGSVSGNLNLSLRLSAAEDTGMVRIVSAPKITVLNSAEAVISQGVSIPISVVSAQGVQTQFVPADLQLKAVPHVSQRDCSIMLELVISKNEADFVNRGARGDPTILRKEAKTKLLIADGETTVIGGIYTRNSGLSYKRVPYLAEIPILGWFFKSRRQNDERSEILIFITPRITNKALLRCEAK